MIGKLLGGRYRVVKILGAGGFGQTYVAEDTHRPGNPKCVVKHLKPASGNSSFLQNARRLFQSEAETLEKLGNHDQIPRLLAYFEENQEFYLVQDFIQGHPLNVELQPSQRWTESKVCQLLHEVLGILVYVHSHGVIHRDIKPNNLIRRQQDSTLVLVDFGSVKQAWTQVVTELTQTRATFAIGIPATIGIGTPGYMPIEQERGRPRHNSDIYALGMIGIQALTGLNPRQLLEDSDTGEILWQHQAHVSDALASVLTKMVRYHFKDRYPSAAEALQALQLLEIPHPPKDLDSDDGSLLVQQPNTICFAPLRLPTATSISAPETKVLSALEPQASHFSQSVIPAEETANSLDQVNLKENHPSIPATHNQYSLRIGAGIAAVIISVIAGYAIYWQPRPSISKPLEQIETLKAEGKYEECMNQAATVPQDSRFYNDAQALLHECQLAQAKNFAANQNFKAAITEAGKIPQDAAFHQDAQQLIGQWSNSILEIATNKYQSGKLNDAIAIAKIIPESSPVYQKAQEAIKQWNGEWEKNNSYLQAAKSALDEGRWQNAISEGKKVIDTPHSKEKIEPIIQKVESKTAVTSQPTRATRLPTRTTPRRVSRVTKSPTRTTPRRVTRVTKSPTRTTPKRVTRATRLPTRTTPKRVTRVTRPSKRTTPKRVTRVTRPSKRTTPKRVTRVTRPSKRTTSKRVTRVTR